MEIAMLTLQRQYSGPSKAALPLLIGLLALFTTVTPTLAQKCEDVLIRDIKMSSETLVDDLAIWSLYDKDTANGTHAKFSSSEGYGEYSKDDFQYGNQQRERILDAFEYESHKEEIKNYVSYYLSDNATAAYIACLHSNDDLQLWIEHAGKQTFVLYAKVTKELPRPGRTVKLEFENGKALENRVLKEVVQIPKSEIRVGQTFNYTMTRTDPSKMFAAKFCWGRGQCADQVVLPPYKKVSIVYEDEQWSQQLTQSSPGTYTGEPWCTPPDALPKGAIYVPESAWIMKVPADAKSQVRITHKSPTQICVEYVIPGVAGGWHQLQVKFVYPKVVTSDE